MKAKPQNSIRRQLMVQTGFFALVFVVFASIAIWQVFSFTQEYIETTKRNSSIRLASWHAISSAKQMDWLIQRILLSQYRGNSNRVIAYQSELLETMADFEMFIEALNWGSESAAFKKSGQRMNSSRWREQGWDKRILLEDLPEDIRQYAGTAHLYYTAFMRYTHVIITHIQGYLNSLAENDTPSAERNLFLANEANKKVERYENLGSETLNQLIDLTHQMNQNSLTSLQQSFRTTLTWIALSAVLLLLIFFIVNHIFFSNLIAKPIERLTAEVQKIDAEGLNTTLSTSSTGEIASLILKFNELISHLRQTTVKRDSLVREIESHKTTAEKLQLTNQALEMKKSELTSILIELKKSHEELRQAQMRLVEAAKLESVGRLAAGVAHEVKNPLFIIQMGVDYLSKLPELSAAGNSPNAVLQDIGAAVERANIIIKGLLSFAAPHDFVMEKTNINHLIEDALSFLKHLLASHHTRVIKNLGPDLPLISLDTQKMHQVFINLIMNAVQASLVGGGTLTLHSFYKPGRQDTESDQESGWVAVEIMDTGAGFTDKSLERAFDPFFTTKPAGQGTGLGLAVTKKIIEVHGGFIRLENREEGGAKVTIQIPTERRTDYAQTKNTGHRR